MARSPLAPLAPWFAALNWVAFVGWSFVLYRLATSVADSYPEPPFAENVPDALTNVILGLEAICAVEVLRILLRDLPGNLVLGAVLHAIRISWVVRVMPSIAGHWTVPSVLASWAATEVTRYPMYMFPGITFCRSVRVVVPLFTFPVGAFSEGFGAYLVFRDPETESWVHLVMAVVLFVNGVLGPTMAYPALLKKGLPVLGLDKKRKERAVKKTD